MLVVKALICLGGLGLIFSVILAIAHTRLAVKVSEKQQRLVAALPGANCGACGFAGCEAYAEALATNDEVEANLCTVGGKETAEKIAEILGVEVKVKEETVVRLRCQGGKAETSERFTYLGIDSCAAANLVALGSKSCTFGCLGFGDCVEVCPFDAIKMGDNGLPVIDEEKCTGCGKCVAACPKNILELLPKVQKVYVACNSPKIAKEVRAACKIGCIACKICEKSCPYDAIHVVNNLARIDYEKCENCGICVHKCPTHCIVETEKKRPKAMIGTKCTGCEECKAVCPVKAITGEPGEQHVVDLKKCIGCALCYKTCKYDAITMAFALGYKEKVA